MNITKLTQVVSANSGLSAQESRKVVRTIFRAMHDALVRGEDVKMRHIGTLYRKQKAKRNVKGLTGVKRTHAGDGVRIAFTPSTGLIDRIESTRKEG